MVTLTSALPASISASTITPARSDAKDAQRSSSSRLLSPPSAGTPGSALIALARAPLMGMNPEAYSSSNSLALASSNGDATTPTGESSNTIIGPNGVLVPRASILLNPSKRRTFVDQWRSASDGEGPRPAPAVLRIAAVPTAKDREKLREQERIDREREIEREVREKEQAERVWGIPKRAFYLGLGEINFNAQMAMLGGWGNGSADVGPVQSSSIRKHATTLRKIKKQRRASTGNIPKGATGSVKGDAVSTSAAAKRAEAKDGAESDASMDLEELAQLNAIINTRRSMEAAQKMANSMAVRPMSKRNATYNEASTISDPSTPSVADDSSQVSESAKSSRDSQSVERRVQPQKSYSDNIVHQAKSNRIRFAPLPFSELSNHVAVDGESAGHDNAALEAGAEPGFDETASDYNDSLSDDDDEEFDDGDESWSRRLSGGRGSKWFTMGMPKGMFTSQYYRSLRRPSSSGGVVGDQGGVGAATGELSSSPSSERRLSTGSVALPSTVSDGMGVERRGRRTRRPTSRASSIKSRSSSVGSIDDEERERRRQLVRSTRPGGTGMLTLPDGTRIRARRVGERYSDEEDAENQNESRVEEDESKKTRLTKSEKRSSDDEGGRESDATTTGGVALKGKRRRREGSAKEAESSALEEEKGASEGSTIEDPSRLREDVDDVTNDKVSHSASNGAIVPEAPESPLSVLSKEEPSHDRQQSPLEETELPKQSDVEDSEDSRLRQAPKRSFTLPAGRTAFTADRAAEMRRRHEQEVGALEAEVLHNIAKAKKAKQQELQQAQENQKSQMNHNSNVTAAHNRHSSHTQTSQHAGATASTTASPPERALSPDQHDRGRTKMRPWRSQTIDESAKQITGKMSPSLKDKMQSSPLRNHLRSNSTRHARSRGGRASNVSTPVDDHHGDVSPFDHTSPLLLASNAVDDEQAGAGGDGDLTASISSLRTVRGARQLDASEASEALSQEGLQSVGNEVSSPGSATLLVVPSSASTDLASSDAQMTQRNASPDKRGKAQGARQSHRVPDLPSLLDLPRKPNARGYTVVPLPIDQLGRRPDRPREGRVWSTEEEEESQEEDAEVVAYESSASDDEDDGDHEERYRQLTKSRKSKRVPNKYARSKRDVGNNVDEEEEEDEVDDDKDSDESDLDAEQLAEEERRTAVQKKRATTRAAGAELVSSMAKHKGGRDEAIPNSSASGRFSGRPYKRSTSKPPRNSNERLRQEVTRSRSSTSLTKAYPITGDQSRYDAGTTYDREGGKLRPTLSTTVLSTSRDRRGNSVAKIYRRRDTWNDFDDATPPATDAQPVSSSSSSIPAAVGDAFELSDGDDLWPPTLDKGLGGTVSSPSSQSAATATHKPSFTRLSSQRSNVSSNSSTKQTVPSSPSHSHVALADYSSKARAIRERREKEMRERDRARLRARQENEDSLDYGWPKSLDGSSLY